MPATKREEKKEQERRTYTPVALFSKPGRTFPLTRTYVYIYIYSYMSIFQHFQYISLRISQEKEKRKRFAKFVTYKKKKRRREKARGKKKKGAKRLKPSSRLIARTPPNAQVSFIASRFTHEEEEGSSEEKIESGHNRDSIGPRA